MNSPAYFGEIFSLSSISNPTNDEAVSQDSGSIPPPKPSPSQKLVIFTEHRDTLSYLEARVTTLLGRKEAVVIIHGGMGREDRMKSQEAFRHDPEVNVLIATDAAGEGINLQRAHLMVNYDLPWNPNRIEQRFGRIHRIGQTEVCHLWNLVAVETREGDVYHTLLEKLEQARQALGGQVFDVLGKIQFEGRPLRELLIEAIRYGDRPETRAKLKQAIADAVDRPHLQNLLEDRALAHDVMDASRVARVREDMERAEARRLQPHYVESFFLEAFTQLGGTVRQREPRRYEVTHVRSCTSSAGSAEQSNDHRGSSDTYRGSPPNHLPRVRRRGVALRQRLQERASRVRPDVRASCQCSVSSHALDQSGSSAGTPVCTTSRMNHTATLLPNGEVLVAGGDNTTGLLATAEL